MASQLRPGKMASKRGQSSASKSHTKNEEYMSDFEKAWKEMNGGEEITATVDGQSDGNPLHPVEDGPGPEFQSDMPSCVVDGWMNGPVEEVGALLATLPPVQPGRQCSQACAAHWQLSIQPHWLACA